MLGYMQHIIKKLIRKKIDDDIYHSREYFQHRLEIEKQRADRRNENFSVITLCFKILKDDNSLVINKNDLISDISDVVFSLVRKIDVAAHYDRDSLAVLLCDTSTSGAKLFLKRLNTQLVKLAVQKSLQNSSFVNNININIYSYPDNPMVHEFTSSRSVAVADYDFGEPVNLNGQLSKNATRNTRQLIKRGLDIVLSYLGIIIFAPLMAVIAAAIKLTSPGPIIYRQKRIGYNGKIFELYKFRSMYHQCDENVHKNYLAKVINLKPTNNTAEIPTIKILNDNRVTPLGRFLRDTCLDELPQLINVFKGDMSLVGPRPHPEYEVEYYRDWYLRRLSVKPGLTGLWQIQGKKNMFYPDAIRLDLSYIDNWSVGLDFKIICYTLPTAIAGFGSNGS